MSYYALTAQLPDGSRDLIGERGPTIQHYIVNLGFPTSDKTREFLRDYACLVFKDDDATRGLHRLTARDFYSDGPHGAGINVMDPSLTKLDYCP
jgi:hypothetical protein